MPIDGRRTHGHIVGELIAEYKKNGKIGNTTPKNLKDAERIANAIAYKTTNKDGKKHKSKAKTEALKLHIASLIRPENRTFIEGIVMKGFKTCFESDEAIVNLDDTDNNEDNVKITSDDNTTDNLVTLNPESLTQEENDAIKAQMDKTQESKSALEDKADDLSDQAADFKDQSKKLKDTAASLSLNNE